jgi:hypothetical protein
MKLITAIYKARKHREAPKMFDGEGTGFNPMVNPSYREFSEANRRLKESPRIEGLLKKIGWLK